ncbi:MAG: AMP-binding protein [Kiritimatiellia bacterium]
MVRALPKFASLVVLAACIAAALVFRRFVFVAYYPVVMSVAVASGFGLSLLRRKTLCEELAEKIPPGILPQEAPRYCRRLTAIWCAALLLNGGVALATVFAPRWVWFAWNCALSYAVLWGFAGLEWRYRRRRFARTFCTSGSTAKPKSIVKTFDTLAKEVAYHRRVLQPQLAARPLFLSTVEPQHMYGTLWRVLLPQAAGCPVDPEVILTPESLLAKMKAAARVFLVTTPSFLERFTAYAEMYDVPRNCVEITTSGALLTAAVSAATKRVFGIAPREIFGSTETGGVAWRRQDGGDELWTVFDPVRVSTNADGRLVVDSPFSFRRGFVMGDGAVCSGDGRHFRLLGRRDRLVKVAERRVLLPEMEAEMAKIPGIKEAALCPLASPHGTCLGAVVVWNGAVGSGASKRRLALSLRSRLMPIFPKGTVPKKYRFVHELPRNAQGKVLMEELVRLFATNLAEPFVSGVKVSATSWTGDFVFDPDAPYFKGHFPGVAVLPGVVQLGLAHRFAERAIRRQIVLTAVRKMKFTRAIVPGETIRFSLVRKSDREWAYDYRKGDLACSSGILCF